MSLPRCSPQPFLVRSMIGLAIGLGLIHRARKLTIPAGVRHGTKRAPAAQELDRICDVATKRLRMLEVSPVAKGGAMVDEEEMPDIDYHRRNDQLKAAHLQYLQERQRRGLPGLNLPADSNDMEDDDDSDDEGDDLS